MLNLRFNLTLASLLIYSGFMIVDVPAQGPINPPGAPGATMKSLDDIYDAISAPVNMGQSIAAADLPLEIQDPGYYYLAESITFAQTNTTAITVAVDGVTIDLAGQSLIGPGTAAGTTGSGIAALSGVDGMVIKNGYIREWRNHGIDALLARDAVITGIHVQANGFSGIAAGSHSRVSHCSARSNIRAGISVLGHSQVRDCTAARNQLGGVKAAESCTITSVLTEDNALFGIQAGDGAVVSHCAAEANEGPGITAGAGSALNQCAARRNEAAGISAGAGSVIEACAAEANLTAGIEVSNECVVAECAARGNLVAGIRAGDRNIIRGNNASGNGPGDASGTGIRILGRDNRIERNEAAGNDTGLAVEMDRNVVRQNLVKQNGMNFDFAAGNQLELLIAEIPQRIEWPAQVTVAGTMRNATSFQHGLHVASDNVAIDLGGATLLGPSPSGNVGHGIYVEPGLKNVSISNGGVAEWNQDGIHSDGEHTRVTGIVARANLGAGIFVGAGALVKDCEASSNTKNGIHLNLEGTALACVARRNGDRGIVTGSAAIVTQCSTRQNGKGGISTGNGSNVTGCSAYMNTGAGLEASDGATLTNNSSMRNTGDGILVSDACMVTGNTCEGNGTGGTGAGIRATGFDNRLDGNNVTGNVNGISVETAGSIIIRNSASGSTGSGTPSANYNFTGTQTYGPIVTGTGQITETNPWANFSF